MKILLIFCSIIALTGFLINYYVSTIVEFDDAFSREDKDRLMKIIRTFTIEDCTKKVDLISCRYSAYGEVGNIYLEKNENNYFQASINGVYASSNVSKTTKRSGSILPRSHLLKEKWLFEITRNFPIRSKKRRFPDISVDIK